MPARIEGKPVSAFGRGVSTSWTEDDAATLFRLRNRGLSWPAIARILKRPESSCQKRHTIAHLSVLPPRPRKAPAPRWPVADVALVLELRAKGLQWVQIAHACGRTMPAVRSCWVREQNKIAQPLDELVTMS